jgi:hypothetical protein
LRARLAEYLLHLRLLFGVQLEAFAHLLEAVAPSYLRAVAHPGAVDRRRERARREAEHEDGEGRHAHEPAIFSHPVHVHLASSSSDS